MEEIKEEIERLLDKVASDLGLEANKKLKLEINQQYGHHFKINRNVSSNNKEMEKEMEKEKKKIKIKERETAKNNI